MFVFSPETPNLAVNIKKTVKLKMYRTVILSIVRYDFESWSTSRSVEHKLRVFENKILRKIYGPKGTRRLENGGGIKMIYCLIHPPL